MATEILKKNELKFEDFEPVSEWQELPEKYIVRVDFPGFGKECLRVQVDALGNLTVEGQKPIDNNKGKRFHRVFQLPQDSDIEKIRGEFEGILTITVPRKVNDCATLNNMLEVINRNKKEIIVGMAAFSIGILVCRKLGSGK